MALPHLAQELNGVPEAEVKTAFFCLRIRDVALQCPSIPSIIVCAARLCIYVYVWVTLYAALGPRELNGVPEAEVRSAFFTFARLIPYMRMYVHMCDDPPTG